MTTTLAPDALVVPAPAATRPTFQRRRRRARSLVGALLVLVVAAGALADYWVSVQDRSPRALSVAPIATQRWVRSVGDGPRAYFRLPVALDALPASATLWVEADQAATVYVDGVRLAQPARTATVNGTYYIRAVETIDLRPALVLGANVVGLEVVNFDNRAPAFRARVELRYGSSVQSYGVGPAAWRSTDDAALTSQVLPGSGGFSTPALAAGDWTKARAAGPRPGTDGVATPPAAFATPALRPALAGTESGRTLAASTTIDVPTGCTTGWLRVAANGPYSVLLDGQTIATGNGTWQQLGVPYVPTWQLSPVTGTLPLTIYDLCPVASGREQLRVVVDSPGLPVVYLDGQVSNATTTTTFGTGAGWRVTAGAAGTGGSSGASANLVADPEKYLGSLFQRTTAPTVVPGDMVWSQRLLRLGELAGILVLAIAGAVLLGADRRRAVGAAAVGVLPVLGLLAVLAELRHFIGVQPPFPSTPTLLWVALGVAGAGLLAALGSAVLGAPRPGAARSAVAVSGGSAPGRSRSPVPREVMAPAPARRGSGRPWVFAHRYALAVVGVAVVWVAVLSYRITYQPLWQDELSSIAAAQGVAAHVVPRWPSGFLYWKSELYSALIAVVGTLSHWRTSWMREVSTLWFGATVVLFGFRLMPTVLPGRRLLQLAAVVGFASASIEQTHARDVRMYQMEQFFALLLVVLLFRTVREPTTRRIAAVNAVAVCMYLSHEESFCILPLIPLALCAFQGVRWLRDWRWWVFGSAAGTVIVVQLALAKLTHPPAFGVDLSGGPLIQWSPQPFYYVVEVFFNPAGAGAALTVLSSLAVIGALVGWRRRLKDRLFLAACWLVPVAVVSLFLPAKNARYAFVTIPFVVALAYCGATDVFDLLRRAVTHGEGRALGAVRRASLGALAGLGALAMVMSTVGSLSDYGPAAEALVGSNVQHFNLDYPDAVSYVKAHLQPGDAVIAVGPANLTGWSLGRAPTYWVSANRTQTLLYVFEKDNQVVDTQYGIPVLVNAEDFERAVDSHPRVWLVVADENTDRMLPGVKQILTSRFQLRYEGESVSAFLATN
jgi:hypothetical protein